MILILGGTSDSRELIKKLSEQKNKFIICTVTDYGGDLANDSAGVAEILKGRLEEGDLVKLIISKKIRILIDATHPFADIASANARNACLQTGIQYLRFERPSLVLPKQPLIHPVGDYDQAAIKAAELAERTIFVTTGTKTLPIFTRAAYKVDKRVVARILPNSNGLKLCHDLGIYPSETIAIQGPFSTAMNKLLLTEFKADVLVTKESGIVGGTDTKIEAALELSVPVVVINRPPAPAEVINSIETLLAKIMLCEEKVGK